MRQMKIKIKTNKDRTLNYWYWFVVCGANGRITSTSETYPRKRTAEKTAQTYIDNGLNAVIVLSSISSPECSAFKNLFYFPVLFCLQYLNMLLQSLAVPW